ncbi:alpha/beta hydrolase [Xanthobacter sp. V4C-4]|uniref:alpha/beta fold hydrolase n=1 Tax=Xanthobacter cornucopiae TaxID=3119924 RepID=UPI0037294123
MAIEAPRRILTDRLELHVFDDGPADGPVALLLHGWPDAPQTWAAVAARLNAAGWRTLRPYLRGFGPTRFLAPGTPRSGQITALAADALALADGLGLARFAVIGHDWGARTAYTLAALAPERVSACVALSVGYGGGGLPTLQQARNYWYQWYFCLPQGAAALAADRHGFCRALWQTWSPGWTVPDAAFAAAADAFDAPDWLAVTLHSYRQRWGHADGDPHYDDLEETMRRQPAITVPALVIHGSDDACNDAATSQPRDAFRGPYRRLVLPGIGHFPQREAGPAVSSAIAEWLGDGRAPPA